MPGASGAPTCDMTSDASPRRRLCRRALELTLQEREAEFGAPHALARHQHGHVLEVQARRVDVGRVAQAELHVDRRDGLDQRRNLVVAHEPAKAVGHLDVHVERHVAVLPDGRQVGQRQIGRHVDRRGAFVGEHGDGQRVGGRQLHADLDDQVGRQVAGLLGEVEDPQQPHVGHQHAADAQFHRPDHIVQRVAHLILAAQLRAERAARGRHDRRPGVPGGARPDEQRQLHARLATHAAHLADLGVGEQHDARALRHAMDRHGARARLLEHRGEHARALDARDLDAVVRAVREAMWRRRQIVRVAGRQVERGQQAGGGRQQAVTCVQARGSRRTLMAGSLRDSSSASARVASDRRRTGA